MARKAKPKIITVDGERFLVRRTWGQRKDFLRQREDIVDAEKKRNEDYDPNETMSTSREHDEAMLAWTDTVVAACVVQWEDEEGVWHDWIPKPKEAEADEDEDYDELDADEAQKLVAACLGDVKGGVEIEGVVPLERPSE